MRRAGRMSNISQDYHSRTIREALSSTQLLYRGTLLLSEGIEATPTALNEDHDYSTL